MRKKIISLFSKNNVDNDSTENVLNVANTIKEISKQLQEVGGTKMKPKSFHTSKGELIDLRTQKNVGIDKENEISQNDTGAKKKSKTTIYDFIQNVKDKEDFLKAFKRTFNIETNTEIAIVINLFEKEKIICYSTFAPFYREIKNYLNRDIGNQNTINDAIKRIQKGTQTREAEFEKIKEKVNNLINNHLT